MRFGMWVAATLAVSSCVGSGDLKTSEIKATYRAVASADGWTVYHANFNAPGKGSVIFADPDLVNITVNGKTTRMNQTSGGLELQDRSAPAGSTITFTFQRANEKVVSTVILPAPFSVTSDHDVSKEFSPERDSVRLNASLPTNAGEVPTWFASGDCIDSKTGTADATGATIESEAILMNGNTGCPVTLALVRTNTGTAASGLASGSTITAAQSRSVELTALR